MTDRVNEMAAAAVRTRLQALTDLFDDADLEAGMRQITEDDRARLVRLLQRAGKVRYHHMSDFFHDPYNGHGPRWYVGIDEQASDLHSAGQPIRVTSEFGGLAACPLCGANLILTREPDGCLLVPEHDSCLTGGTRLAPDALEALRRPTTD